MQNKKTSGESLIDILNTETFVAILAEMQGEEKAKDHHVEYYKMDREKILDAHDFFMTLPWLSKDGQRALGAAMVELIDRANA